MRTVVLTGAGISAESGVPTFRDAGGLWEGHDVVAVATPEGYAADPDLVHRFYDARRRALTSVATGVAHHALARLEAELGDDLLVVTQNVDDLHERAGSTRVLHMHGELSSALCTECGGRAPWREDLGSRPPCPRCAAASLRPDIVWFGEVPYQLDEIVAALQVCDVFVAIGTSGEVYPAAGFVALARASGARTVQLNLEPSEFSMFDDVRAGPATRVVPEWVADALAEAAEQRA